MKTMGINAAYSMTWKELMKMMTKVYYHRNEIPKMENELWNLTVKDNEVVNYTQPGTMRLENTIRLANYLMEHKVRAISVKDADKKRKWEDEQEENHRQQQNKRQEVGRVYVAGTGNKTDYAKTLPLCDKCKLHHHGKGHTKRYCPGTENQNGDEDAHQNLDIVTGTFLLKNRYVPVLTSTSANGSFVFTTNSQLSDVTSTFPVT
ncbi:hypothetical protein Tco_0425484 [Tanacetum coccineum]